MVDFVKDSQKPCEIFRDAICQLMQRPVLNVKST